MYPKEINLCVKFKSFLWFQSIFFCVCRKLGKTNHCLFFYNTSRASKHKFSPNYFFFRLTALREFTMPIICSPVNLSPSVYSCLISFLLYQEFTFFLAFVSLAAAMRTLRGTPLWSGRPSAATWAVSMLKGRWTITWTPSPSSKRSWSCEGSLSTAPTPSGWRRCWWPSAAPVSPPLSATWLKSFRSDPHSPNQLGFLGIRPSPISDPNHQGS